MGCGRTVYSFLSGIWKVLAHEIAETGPYRNYLIREIQGS